MGLIVAAFEIGSAIQRDSCALRYFYACAVLSGTRLGGVDHREFDHRRTAVEHAVANTSDRIE